MEDRLGIPRVVGLKYFPYGIPLPRDAVLGTIILKMETHRTRLTYRVHTLRCFHAQVTHNLHCLSKELLLKVRTFHA